MNKPIVSPLMTEGEAAAWLQTSPATLRRWRSKGQGPAWSKPCGVRYRLEDLEEYVRSKTVTPKAQEPHQAKKWGHASEALKKAAATWKLPAKGVSRAA
ncbi:MAG: helix-turn-helix domain-containing protein [Magnetococcales bacterium]|nr:helix-turn-helix domain-containing protein [Magnetococcales bacterium]